MLLCSRTIDANPIDHHRYKSEKVLNETTEQENVVPRLKTITQLVTFLNLVYLPYNPNSKIYEEKSVTVNILSKVWNHSDLFADKSPTSFNKWCSTRNIKFFAQQSKRRRNDLDESQR
ncbi:hypothetical protein BCV71DRAFT_4383 [Rhizopus microsporus]|uniref:Uncharacterized protein n=1 Tax=Rhizopus microsporus TaxID=58291 RepID=A0A1X0RYZ4_RHIZD|nr:hypothetical protein BCV71DRAFT_4383 [Rhizopus microsporus]